MTKENPSTKVQIDRTLHTRAKTYASSKRKRLSDLINEAVRLHLDRLGAPEIDLGGE